jgi:nitronate monooxygenase
MFQLPSIPIWQAPTGSVAGPELAAAVSAAGGMGAMGLTWTAPEAARAKVEHVLAVTQNPFQANFALHFEPLALPAALEAGLPVVTFSWGLPSTEAALVRSFGAGLGIQVVNREGALRALELQPDFLIVQGVEAGGHVQASRRLSELLIEVMEIAGEVPIVAAGGLATAEDVSRVLNSGAKGAMLGTRFVATRESLAHEEYKQALVAATETALTVCFDGGWAGAVHRVLRNSTLEAWEAAGCPLPGFRPSEGETVACDSDGDAIPIYDSTAPRLGMEGEIERMCLYAGESCRGIQDVPPAGELVVRLWEQVQRL